MKNLTNVDLETQVIGTLLRAGERGNRDIVFETQAHLRTAEVFSMSGGAIRRLAFEAICEVAREGAPPSRHTVGNRLRRQRVPNAEFVDTAAAATTLSNKDTYRMALDALVELFQARKVATLLEDGRRLIDDGGESGDVARQLSRELLQAIDRAERDGGTFRELAQNYENSVRELTEKPESMWSVRWGIDRIDMMLGEQIRGGQFVVVGAHTGVGKSVTATDIIRANGVHGDLYPVILSLEMRSADVFDRLLSSVSSVPYTEIRDRKVRPNNQDRLHEGLQLLRDKRGDGGWVEHMPWAWIHEIEAKIRALHATYGSKVIIVDYIQLIRMPRNHNREREVTEAARTLKMLADELDITVFGLAQLNDEIKDRRGADRRPFSNDARECKNIEKDADVSVVIDRPVKRKDDYFWDGAVATMKDARNNTHEIARFDFDKTRRGETGWVPVLWEGRYQRFSELPDGLLQMNTSVQSDTNVF